MKMNNKILIVAAHPDDEILGCGGTIARLVKEGYKASILILGEGVTSRDQKRDTKKRENELARIKQDIIRANKIIGISDTHIFDLPDNRFDSVDMLDIVKIIEKVKNRIKPDIIFTHYKDDLNIDHQITFQAVLTATRPDQKESVKEIYSFEIPSSTEWSFSVTFSPNVFYNIKNTLSLKIRAMLKYTSEIKKYPHPRSVEAIKNIAENWGIKSGFKSAEAFHLVRLMK